MAPIKRRSSPGMSTACNINNNENARRSDLDGEEVAYVFRYSVIGEDGQRYKKDSRRYLHKKKSNHEFCNSKSRDLSSVNSQIVTRSRARALLRGCRTITDPMSGAIMSLTASEADLTTARNANVSRKSLRSDTTIGVKCHKFSEPNSDVPIKTCRKNSHFRNSNGSEVLDSDDQTIQSSSMQTLYCMTSAESDRDMQTAAIFSQAEYIRQLQYEEMIRNANRRDHEAYDVTNRGYRDMSPENVDSLLSDDVRRSMKVKSDESTGPVLIVVDRCQDREDDT